MALFSGLSAFPITPMTSGGEVIAPDLQRLVRRIEAGGADSVGLLGSTGTYMFLSRDERRRAVAAAVEVAVSIPIIVGVGAMRTDEAQALAHDAATEGAAGLLLAPVSYTPLTEEEVFRHFLAVASATDLPLCIYSNPGTTNFTFSPDLVARLTAIPSIAAIKLPLPANGSIASDLAAFRAAAPDLSIGYSGDWGCKEALLAGADCWYSVAGGLFPEQAAALTTAAMKNDRETAGHCDDVFADLWKLFREQGSLRLMYAAANLMGLTQAQPPKPLQPLEETLQARLARVLPNS
ncbi:dihydrodipicolinate synthase family protein [Brevundimonas pondensis]|uniref:Dihydrodipicolinate synthase family protein n=1 Tax=Brevundimonas pondensis TaxID=2774189 RepID=A0ABX7SQ96_9CAUL|nr:dihydrodipicolinate synthase family protein [Brevundimonas pondensis]QTC88561.1 dihydrodipicolinate synthase family protein [Brevundimonas pondensis]